MDEFEIVKSWVENQESFLSGLAAVTFLATLIVAPMAATTRALHRRRRDDGLASGDGCGLSTEQILSRPAVAVLPFANQSDDPEQVYFAAGITEDLITALSSFRCFPVIGRSSVFAGAAPERDGAAIARELSAGYVVQGTVRREGEQVRITAHLIDAGSGHTLWARSYDRAFAGVFELQDEITQSIVSAIEPRLEREGEKRALAAPSDALDAFDCSLRALWHVRQGTRDDYAKARQLLDWAILGHPLSSRAHSVLALCLFQEALLGWHDDPPRALAGTLRAARAAVELDDDDWLAHALLGIATMWTLRDFERALGEQDRALELNPSASMSHQFRACVLQFAGRPEEAIRSLELVLRLEPRYQSRSLVLADLSLNHLLLGDVEAAIDFARRALAEAPDNLRAHQRLVAALGHKGDAEAIEVARTALLARQPDLAVSDLEATYPFKRPEDLRQLASGLLYAGIPEDRPGHAHRRGASGPFCAAESTAQLDQASS
jgi:TolB-like protein